jgi:hypothetical protein
MGLSLTRRDPVGLADLVVQGLVQGLVRDLVDRDRAGRDPVDMRGRVGLHLADLAVRRRRGRVDLVDMRGRVGLHLAVRRRRGRVDLVDMRGRVGLHLEDLAVRRRRDPVDLVARADLDMRGRVGLGVRDRQDRVDHRRRHTGLGVSTARVVPRWAVPTMRLTASVHPTTVRRLRRHNADSAGMAGLLPEGRRLTGSGRHPRVAGTDLRLPVVGTADGMGRRAI